MSELMELDFESIVLVAHQIRFEVQKKSLQDSELSALYCAWFRVSYVKFIENQSEYQQQYWHLYRKPLGERSIHTIPASSCRVMRMFEAYFSLPRLTQKNFRGAIEELYKSKNQKLTNLLLKIRSKNKEVNEKIVRDDTIDKQINQNNAQNSDISKQENSYSDDFNNNEIFVGRKDDIENIIQILKSKPIILLQGFSGIGKTSLLDQLGRELSEYEYYYTDFRYINSFDQWMASLLSLSGFDCGTEFTELIKQTIKFFETTKSLVIIDSIAKFSDNFSGFLESYALNTRINSRIIIASSLSLHLNVPSKHYQRYRLKGLTQIEDLELYFQHLGLNQEDKHLWPDLVEQYSGNFRELKYVSKFIKNFYGGRVSKYLGIGSNILSSDLKSFFDSIEFTEMDHHIFNVCYQNKAILSEGLMLLLRKESSTSEIFSRISYLSEHGFLNCLDSEDGMVRYSISPLLENYLIQEKMINV